jgi:proline dehydrogenase
MFRRTWQAGMIALARSNIVKQTMQDTRGTSALAARYVAGENPEAGVSRAATLLMQHKIHSSLFYLGEYVDRPLLVSENVAAKLAVVEKLGHADLDVHVSVDPTQIGQSINAEQARRNAFAIAEAIARSAAGRPGFHALMLDMEDESVVNSTIALHDDLRAARLPVALTLQAYLRRTEGDLQAQIARGSRVRLVKGAFAAGTRVAFTRQGAIKTNFRHLIELMLSRQAREAGFYPVIATHDDHLHAHAIEHAEGNGWHPSEFEFEMLLGVRDNVARALAARGHQVRLYVPFGRDWWPYAVRRIGENPRNAWLLARSLVCAT